MVNVIAKKTNKNAPHVVKSEGVNQAYKVKELTITIVNIKAYITVVLL